MTWGKSWLDVRIYAKHGANGNPGAAVSIGGTQDISNYHGVTLNAAPTVNKGRPWQTGQGSSKGKGKQGDKPSLSGQERRWEGHQEEKPWPFSQER